MDGGDVLRIGSSVYVGISGRTNRAGADQLRAIVEPWGLRLHSVEVRGALHLKTACTAPGPNTVLLNPAWVDPGAFPGVDVIEVPSGEAFGANVLPLEREVVVSASAPRTREILERRGFTTRAVDISEFEKAEGGLTCLSLPCPQLPLG